MEKSPLRRMAASCIALALLTTGCSGQGPNDDPTVAEEQDPVAEVLAAACGDAGSDPSTVPPEAVAAYACRGGGAYDGFVKFFDSIDRQEAWMRSLTCTGGAVAGPGWVAHQIGATDAQLRLIDLGGTEIC